MNAAWSALVFPVLGLTGAVLLLIHDHGNMNGSDPMLTMVRVQNQHMRFAMVGAGIALTKGIAEIDVAWRRIFGKGFVPPGNLEISDGTGVIFPT